MSKILLLSRTSSMIKVLITGSSSLLGYGLIKKVPLGFQIFLTHHKNPLRFGNLKSFPLEITNKKETNKLISKLKPGVIIHAAAISDVDWCQKNQEEAWQINVSGTENVARASDKIGSKLVFISSNAVFDGKKPPYNEKSKTNSINFYGYTKIEGEKILTNLLSPYLIVRLITMFGWQPKGARENPVTWELNQLSAGKTLYMVNDRFLTPLYNISAATAIWKLIQNKKTGIYHVAGADRVSRYNWAKLTAEIFGFDSNRIIPVKSDFFKSLTERPWDTSFETKKLQEELRVKPLSLKAGLILMKKEKFLI